MGYWLQNATAYMTANDTENVSVIDSQGGEMSNDPELKRALLALARSGEEFEHITDAKRREWGLLQYSPRAIRQALGSLTFNEKFEAVELNGESYPPLIRHTERGHDNNVKRRRYVPRKRGQQGCMDSVRPRSYYFAS